MERMCPDRRQADNKRLEDATSLLVTKEEVCGRIDTPFRKQRFILLAEGVDTMMLLLIHNVVTDHLLVTFAIGKSSIAVTPTGKHRELISLRLQPLRCLGFEHLHKVANCNVGTDSDEHVDVIGNATNADEFALLALADAEDVGVKIAVMRLGDSALATLGAPNDMVI